MRSYKQHLVLLSGGALLSFAACAVITVNVYFPEKDVKSAYRSLEEELLQPTPKPEDSAPPPKSGSRLEKEPLQTLAGSWHIALVTPAWAQDDLTRRIAEEIKGYPEVVAAYKGRSQRLARLNQLRGQGLAGEGRDGKVVLRAKPPQAGEAEMILLREENQDREVIISGMAKAILKLTRQEATSSTLARVRAQASETFASLRRDEAQTGWWVQLQDGTWTRK